MAPHRHSPLSGLHSEPLTCSTNLRLQILHELPFFTGLSEEEITAVNQLFHERGYEPGEWIYAAGDPARQLYVVATGKVKILRHTLAGKDVLLDILATGEYFGPLSASAEDIYPDSAVAQTMVCALGIDAADFRSVLDRHPRVALRVLDISQARLSAAQEMVRHLSASPVEARIAYSLLKLGEKLGAPAPQGLLIQAPLTREELAGLAGTTTESASRVVSQLQRDGLIRSGRGWIAIRDRAGLEKLTADTLA